MVSFYKQMSFFFHSGTQKNCVGVIQVSFTIFLSSITINIKFNLFLNFETYPELIYTIFNKNKPFQGRI